MSLLARPGAGFFAVLASTSALAGELVIDVSGAIPGRGKVLIAVYDRPEGFPIAGRQRARQVITPRSAHLTVRFEDLPPGSYAAVAFQDLNGNGTLDKGFLGRPTEPYGFSNGARGSMGPPRFSAAAVLLSPDGRTTIVLR